MSDKNVDLLSTVLTRLSNLETLVKDYPDLVCEVNEISSELESIKKQLIPKEMIESIFANSENYIELSKQTNTKLAEITLSLSNVNAVINTNTVLSFATAELFLKTKMGKVILNLIYAVLFILIVVIGTLVSPTFATILADNAQLIIGGGLGVPFLTQVVLSWITKQDKR